MFKYIKPEAIEQFWAMLGVPQRQLFKELLSAEVVASRDAILTMPSDQTPEAFKANMVAAQKQHASTQQFLQQLNDLGEAQLPSVNLT